MNRHGLTQIYTEIKTVFGEANSVNQCLKKQCKSVSNKNRYQGKISIGTVFAIGGGLAGAALGGAFLGPVLGMTGGQLGGFLGMMGGSILGNTLFPAEHENIWPAADNYPIQKSSQGPPVDKIYGTVKKAGHVIWEGDLNPYAIEESSGGKGGDDSVTTGYGYRQSFLLDLGEGPGEILKIWANSDQIYPLNVFLHHHHSSVPAPDITIFEGDDNEGVKDLTGLDYGEWPHNILVFFNQYDLGGSNIKPNFTFEVGKKLDSYFVGYYTTWDFHCVVKANTDSEIITDFSDDGIWGYEASRECKDIFQLDDGRLLVTTDVGVIVMLNLDGSIDTTWGDNGVYNKGSYPNTEWRKILQDNDENFHCFGSSNDGSIWPYHKISADGELIVARNNSSDDFFHAYYDVIWSDETKSRIICVGDSENVGYLIVGNMMALDPVSGDIDITWAGNLGIPGFAFFGSGTIYKIVNVGDGYVILHNPIWDNNDYTLTKLKYSGLECDDTFGDLGYAKAGYPPPDQCGLVYDGTYIYSMAWKPNGHTYLPTWWFRKWDSLGNIVISKDIDDPSSWVYSMMQIIDDNIYVGSTGNSPANNNIEKWDKDFEFISGFDLSGFTLPRVIIPDTSEAVDVSFASMAHDLIENNRYGACKSVKMDHASFAAMESYCLENGFVGSLVINEQKPWRDWLDIICAHFGGWYTERAGLIYLGAYRDETAVFDLSIANTDFVIDEDNPKPPIHIKERDESETFNRIKVCWTDRDNDYASAVTIAQDESDQRRTGTVREKTFNLPGLMTKELATKMAYRLLFESMYRFKIYSFIITYKNMLIEAGDVGTISDGDKIISQMVRILAIDEEINGRGLACVAIEDAAELYPEINFNSQSSLRPVTEDITIEDSDIYFRESDIANELYLSIVPGGAYINGWYIYKSYDDITYSLIGRCTISGLTGGSANSGGTIQSNLPAHGSITWSPDESVLVSIGTITDLHTDISEIQFWNDLRLARIGDEIIAFRDAVETAVAGIWQISCLRRGLFGTEPVAHYSGETFCTLDVNFTYKLSDSDIGKTVYFKALGFYGDYTQIISDIDGQSVSIEGLYKRPAAASLLRLTADELDGGSGQYSGDSFTLYWNLGSRVSGFNYGDWLNLPWNNYIADPELQAIVLKFENEAGVAIGQREIAVGTSATITKATDLGSNDKAIIKVVPRRVYESKLQNSILVENV